jgi:hypothetical protein
MAKRKAAKRKAAKRKAAGRKTATTRRKVGRTRSVGKAASARKKTAPAKKKAAKRASAMTTASARRKAAEKVVTARKASRPRAARSTKSFVKRAAPFVGKVARRAAPIAKKKDAIPARTAPGLNRERRTIRDDDIVQTPPSSLDFDRSASAARSGRRELRERYDEHTETGPAMTGGDVDADWESAYSVGDEAPGGDNPTPDQDLVDDIGRAVGIEYQDNEELKGDAKISKRDRNRWELDPASSDDWDER